MALGHMVLGLVVASVKEMDRSGLTSSVWS
jgi:hypothetical protein